MAVAKIPTINTSGSCVISRKPMRFIIREGKNGKPVHAKTLLTLCFTDDTEDPWPLFINA
jgi:hypothetical protein